MPVVYLNSTTPGDYTGYQFTTAINLINTLDTNLASAGWTTISKVSGTSLFTKGVTSNNHNCWVEFVVSGSAPSMTLTLRGWLEETKINGSPTATHTLTFTEGSINRLWLSADSDAGCICIYNASGACFGYHFGFLNRIDLTDQWAWMLGRLYASGYLYAYVAKAKHANTNWKQLSVDFHSQTDPAGTAVNTVIQPLLLSTFDFTKRIGVTVTSANARLNEVGGTNAAYLAYNGGRNYDGQAIIDPYSYLEGRNSSTAYGVSTTLYFRGFVKFGFCGVASEVAAARIIDNTTGNIILSVGGTQWQGMRIL
jgi:hypothetical protein